ncbi:MAG: hypothetical protein CL596_05280 [Alteromonas sp.]|nr:hypothetical protein [Alteromonas sp.]|tara:strand:- start:463 stop:705 length:243 start_codon:yes stop_codon:yes gene_type:complete
MKHKIVKLNTGTRFLKIKRIHNPKKSPPKYFYQLITITPKDRSKLNIGELREITDIDDPISEKRFNHIVERLKANIKDVE